MNLTAEQLQIASMIDAKMQKLVCDGNDDITILAECLTTCLASNGWQLAFSQVRLKSPSKFGHSRQASPRRTSDRPSKVKIQVSEALSFLLSSHGDAPSRPGRGLSICGTSVPEIDQKRAK